MRNSKRNIVAGVLIVAILGGIIGLAHMNGVRAGVQATPWPTQAEPGFHLVTDTFTATDVWIAPAGVTTTVVEAWGGGGGGDEDQGGGGGGAYARSSVAVTPGEAYYVVVGSGGAAGGGNGTASTFATTTVVAAPGLGGGAGGGLGGTTALSTGDVEFAGGNGMVSAGNAPGGSSAGDAGAGQDGTGTSNIATEAGINNGGWGGAPTVDTSPGQAPGGGGKSESGTNIQTVGGRGEIRITYQVPNTPGYPSVRSATWGRSTPEDDATYTITLPEAENGDLLLLMFNDVRSPVVTPSGWTHLVTASTTNFAKTTWFYKTADGTETTEDLVISGSFLERRSYHALAIDNFTGVPFVASSTVAATTIIDPPSLDTGASDQYLWIMAANVSNANGSSAVDGGNIASISSGYGSYRNNPMPVNINTHQSIISYKLSESQTDDPGSFSRDTARPHVVFTLAIAGEDVASGAISISSADNQSFTVGDPSTAISTITITDAGTPEITDANNIRIRIPSSFPMTFDTSDTTANIGGTDWDHTGAASEGAAVTVTYEDGNKTVVIPVTADFEDGDDITVSGLSFANFSATASTDNLELEVDNGGTVAATDNQTIAVYGPTISSSVNQEFAAGGASTPIATITITDDPDSPTITAGDDIRIRIPSSFPMTWDTSDTEITVAATLADYTDSFNTNDLAVVTADLSGIAYNDETGTFFVVENGTPRINEYTITGSHLRTITLTNFLDTEGIDWMYDNLYAVVQERTTDPYLITFEIDGGTTSVDRITDGTTITPNFTISNNGGMEGVRYVNDRDYFYTAVEKQSDGGNGGRVFLVETSGASTELTALGTALSGLGITDLADLAYDPISDHLFLLGQENNIIIEATASGTIIGTRDIDLGIFTQPEGLDLSQDNNFLFINGEPDDYQLLTRSLNVTSTVSYEDGGKTLVINVTGDFAAGETLVFGGLSFANFSSAASADNLELVVGGASASVADVDDKTISITGGLSIDIVDASGDPVSTPSILFSTASLSFDFQSTTGTLGVSGERLRITNETAGAEWSLSIAATDGTAALWEGVSTDYDFNDPTANAEDGGDADGVGGRLTIDPSGATITPQGGCATTGLSLGSSSGFSEGATDSVTLLTAGSSADVGCFWDLTDVDLTQTIPAQQEGGDYNIDMTLTVVAI